MTIFKKSAVLFVLLFCFSVYSCKKNDNPIVEIVLLAGQSNMAGAGNFDELSDLTKQRIHNVSDRVYLSFNGGKAKPLSYFPNKPTEKYQFTKRFGPELLLGVRLAEKYPEKEFLLIKRTQGGTSLYGAWNPEWSAEKSLEVEKGEYKQNIKLFEMHTNDIKVQIENLESAGRKYRFYGLAWMQGENDAAREKPSKFYRRNLKKLIAAYRKEFETPKLYFVIGQINSTYGRFKEGPEMVRTSQLKVSQGDYYATLVKTSTDRSWSDYPKHSDNVHYNASGLERLGEAFADGFFRIEKRLDVAPFKNINQLEAVKTLRFKAVGETGIIYNVFLPSNFSETKKLPIIIAFSPSGYGRGMLEKMKKSCEKVGWIVVGCDMLKNGMKDEVLEEKMEDEVLDDIYKNIPYDKNKVYLAGFSGGAMRAYGLTVRRPEKIEGIIAYGGWLGGKDYQNEDYQDAMKVAMVNGVKDHGANRWNEIDAKTLEKHNCTVKLFNHPGGHHMAPKESTDEVLKWFLSTE